MDTSTTVQTFTNENLGTVRTIMVNGEPYFVGKDVAEILGYSNTRDALSKHVDDEDKSTVAIYDGSQNRNVTAINESGLYSLILSSKLPSAKQFKRWVTSEVLPAIRKHGSYQIKKNDPDKARILEVKEMNARVRMSNQFLKLANVDTLSKHYKNILIAKSAEVLAGEPILQLPKSEQRMYSATEIGKMIGVSAQKIGKMANTHNMKTTEYGEFYRDKSPYSNKEVDSFRYNDKAVERFKELFNHE